jgi:hypothetical protein
MSSILPKEVTEMTSVSDRHNFKSPSSSPKRVGETSGGNSPRSGATTIRADLEASQTENNEQWNAQLAKNLAGDMHHSKSPPGTLQSRELEEKRARGELNQAGEQENHLLAYPWIFA